VQELKGGQKIQKEQRTMPGYLLINMRLTDDTWRLVRQTPGVMGFVGEVGGPGSKPVPLTEQEVDRILKREVIERPRQRAEFKVGDQVKVVAGPLSDFSGEVAEINPDAGKLKVLVSIFGRETPAEVGFDQVKKIS